MRSVIPATGGPCNSLLTARVCHHDLLILRTPGSLVQSSPGTSLCLQKGGLCLQGTVPSSLCAYAAVASRCSSPLSRLRRSTAGCMQPATRKGCRSLSTRQSMGRTSLPRCSRDGEPVYSTTYQVRNTLTACQSAQCSLYIGACHCDTLMSSRQDTLQTTGLLQHAAHHLRNHKICRLPAVFMHEAARGLLT